MDGNGRPYLFPVPASVLRSLLNTKAQTGKPFTEDEATADLMLDRDHVALGRKRPRANGELHTYDTYAKRWGWGKATVYRAFKGDRHRNLDPWIGERAAAWRDFFGNGGDRDGNGGDQESPKKPPKTKKWDRGGTIGDRGGTHNEQTDKPTDRGGESHAHARGGPLDHPACLAYERAARRELQLIHAEKIAAFFGPDPSPERLSDFEAHVTVYAESASRNVVNVPGILLTFEEDEQRRKQPPGQSGATARRGARNQDIDPGEAFAGIRAAALSAVGRGPGGVDDAGRAGGGR